MDTISATRDHEQIKFPLEALKLSYQKSILLWISWKNFN